MAFDGSVTRSGLTLRPYQSEAALRFEERVAAGVRRIVAVSPTGSGKTVFATHLVLRALAAGQHVVVVAHRREIINQTYEKLLVGGLPEEDVGVIMASDRRRRPGARVQVASIDTLRHRARPRADLVIVDECHRAIARSYKMLAAEYPNAIHLGLTATPYRADGTGLGAAYDELLVVTSPKRLIADGFLVEPRVFTVPPERAPDLSRVKVKGGDFDEGQLADVMNSATLVGDFVDHWHRHARELRTVVFAVSIAHSRHVVERFLAAGVAAEHLDGETPTAQRDAILGRLERGETRVVSNVGVLCEGWDMPCVKGLGLLRPTMSTALYQQQAGRVLRPFEGQRAVILDHAGCVLQHGLPQDDREFSLDDAPKKGRRIAIPKVCPECYATYPRTERTCPECGASNSDVELPNEQELGLSPIPLPTEQAGDLEEKTSFDEERRVWDQLCDEALGRCYRRGWAAHRYREKFGVWPPASFAFPDPRRRSVTPSTFAITKQAIRENRGRLSWDTFDRVEAST